MRTLRPLPQPAVVAAGVALALAGCAMFDSAEPAAYKRQAPASQPVTGVEAQPEEEPAPSEAPASHAARLGGTTTVTETGSTTRRTTRYEFSDDSVEGELTRPDGESVVANKQGVKDNVPRPTPTPRRDGRDDFDAMFGAGPAKPAPDPKAGVDVPRLDPSSADMRGYRASPGAAEAPPAVAGKPKTRVAFDGLDVGGAEKTPEPRREENTDPADYLRHYGVNPTIETSDERYSTFAADVDTGSYTIARGYLERGRLPPEAAVRVEEVVNSFDYGYRPPEREAFAVQVEAFPSPNRKGYHVLHLGLKGREISASARKPASLIFTIDVSGSMSGDNRLGLVKRSLNLLLGQLDARDQVGIVVYGDAARVVLPPTNASDKDRIAAAIHALRSEGSTNVQAGLELAYAQALKAFKPQGVNRVILLSDGVANNGITTADGIFARVKARASEGITLTTVGFGMGDYNDVLMERLADQGDGQYAYVDKLDEARRIFVEQLTGTLQVIAKDVKLQLEFNPEAVARYRLLGFENRALTRQEFHDDKKDAGELGAGHSVTAVYEVKFKSRAPSHFATFRARFKEPRGVTSALVEKQLPMAMVRDSVSASSGPARLSLVAAGFAEKLRGSYWARNLEWGELLELWDTLPEGLKAKPRVQELRALMMKARSLDKRPDRFERDLPVASMDFDRVPVLR